MNKQDMGRVLDISAIQKIIPHRYPFLLVDRILDMGENKIVGIKNVTISEPFFQGHFPGHPVMPGVLILEALAQTGGVYALSMSDNRGKIAYFASIDNAKFRKPVIPGDRLILEVTFIKCRPRIIQLRGVAKIDDEVVAEADLMFALASPEEIKR